MSFKGSAFMISILLSSFSRASNSIPVGQFFLVEQSSPEVSQVLMNVNDISSPGGLVFWNASKSDYAKLRSTISKYSVKAQERGEDPWLFSIDYEGGALSKTPSGKTVAGVQRFVKGFTPLAHPIWLGKSMNKFGTELCELHGAIMGKELSAVGINYPLTVVSDLASRLFSNRGISKNSAQVSECMKAFLKSMSKAESMITVTKHFPGLGQTVGDTHDVVSVSTAKTMEEFNDHLKPFAELIEFANHYQMGNQLSVLASHASFPLVDNKNLTTESSILLDEILVQQLGFQGIRVSDAMWMGDYGRLNGNELYAAYASSFIAGLDLLMIPFSKYKGSIQAFDQLARNQVSPEFKASLEKRMRLSFAVIQEKFIHRANESLSRLKQSKHSLKHAVDVINPSIEPSNLTRSERARYGEILHQLGYGAPLNPSLNLP